MEEFRQEWAVHIPIVLFFLKRIQFLCSRITEEDLKCGLMVKMDNLILNLYGIIMW